MIICGVDLETTGLSPESDLVTEVGAVLWDTSRNEPIKFFNKLIKIGSPVPEMIIKLTGIDDDLLNTFGEDVDLVWKELREFSAKADYLMAHNAPFDRGFIEKQSPFNLIPNKWIDSSVDVPYPEEIQTRKQTHLAAEHGFVNPFAHRAMTDVLTMFQIVSKYDWAEVIEMANTPSVKLRAMVTYGQNDMAKKLSYRWDGTNKYWVKLVKENKVDVEIKKALEVGFTSKRIEV